MPTRTIEAAGGVLWRPAVGGLGVEVALVHRPKYDDWSVPKGKLDAGEPPVVAAVREIREETGWDAIPGRPLGQVRYLKDDTPKRVRYWAMQATRGGFSPTDEVDQLMWLPPREARRHLAPDRDRDIVSAFEADPDPTWAAILVRHASAGERANWSGPDRERPLDELGREQAAALVHVFSVYEVDRVLSADVVRCLETVEPYAAVRNVAVQSEPLLSEAGFDAHPRAAIDRLADVVAAGERVILCSQGRAIPHLLTGVCEGYELQAPVDPTSRKGGGWVLHLAANGKPRLVALERFDPPVQ